MDYSTKENVIIKSLLENDKYINWLNRFSKKYKYFYEDSWGNNCHYISEFDKTKASQLWLFYKIIQDYSHNNDYSEYINYNEVYIPIKNKDNYYLIGIERDSQATFCKRIKESDESFIDYDDIKDYYLNTNKKVLIKK